MTHTNGLTKILAVIGTVLTWFPLVLPLVLALAGLARGHFNFDYLIPGEIFPVYLVGAGALLWAAWRAKSRKGLVGWGLATTLAALVAFSAVAAATGLASGETEPTGWPMSVVGGLMVIWWVGMLVTGVGGVLLTWDVYRVK
jgi:hypothetical protein